MHCIISNFDHSYAQNPPLILPLILLQLADISTRQYAELAIPGQDVDLCDRPTLFKALQEHTQIVAKNFEIQTVCYFNEIMTPLFGIDTFWYRQEFS